MFVHTETNLPPDPNYPTSSFSALGYKINSEGQIVSINAPHHFFPFYITDNERANDVHKEAMHQCARDVIKLELRELGISTLYLSGEMGRAMSMEKPPTGRPFTRILVTDPEALKRKKDVVVVIGEHNQDVGIWAYRSLMREGGIHRGSAIGLVKKLAGLKFNGPLQEDGTVAKSDDAANAPGLILLNPGQRLYSPALHEIMNQNTWQARPRNSAIGSAYLVDETHNHVPGHTTAGQHIATVFDSVIRALVDLNSVRLWIVAICDGAENFISYIDRKLVTEPSNVLAAAVSGMVFMEPQHDITRLQSDMLIASLQHFSQAWVKSSSQLKGEIILNDDTDDEIEADTDTGLKRIDNVSQDLNKSGEEVPHMRTYSAGVDIDELIWPAVMDDVLAFFQAKAEEGDKRGRADGEKMVMGEVV